MKRINRDDRRERQQRAVKKGIRIGLRELSGQLLKIHDPAALEACGLLLLAQAALLSDEEPEETRGGP
ncbi:MAG: hypothetical protein ACRD88_19575 [Terriglobia bacterium]